LQPDASSYAPGPLPARHKLEYLKVALELLLLLLAVPWLIRELARDPSGLSRKAATRHLKG
jgi:hypothetical protein